MYCPISSPNATGMATRMATRAGTRPKRRLVYDGPYALAERKAVNDVEAEVVKSLLAAYLRFDRSFERGGSEITGPRWLEQAGKRWWVMVPQCSQTAAGRKRASGITETGCSEVVV